MVHSGIGTLPWKRVVQKLHRSKLQSSQFRKGPHKPDKVFVSAEDEPGEAEVRIVHKSRKWSASDDVPLETYLGAPSEDQKNLDDVPHAHYNRHAYLGPERPLTFDGGTYLEIQQPTS